MGSLLGSSVYTALVDTATAARPSPVGRGWRLVAALAFAGIVMGFGGLTLVGAWAPERLAGAESGPTTCPWKLATGTRCPFCGMTRATLRMARGDFAGAFYMHPLAPIVFLVVIGGFLVWLYCVAVGREQPRWMRWPRWLAVPAFAIVWVANLVWGHG
jgi:hypothetical protein